MYVYMLTQIYTYKQYKTMANIWIRTTTITESLNIFFYYYPQCLLSPYGNKSFKSIAHFSSVMLYKMEIILADACKNKVCKLLLLQYFYPNRIKQLPKLLK